MAQAQVEAQSQSPDREKPIKAFSCLRCFERKVKCDKNHPCSNCIKSNVDCHFRIPSAPRRKKKKRGTEEILLDRLNRAEELLRSKGILVDQPEPTTSPSSSENTLPPLANISTPTSERPLEHRSPPTQSNTQPCPVPHFNANVPFAQGKLIVDRSGSRSRFIDNSLWSSVSSEFRDPQDALADDSSDEEDGETVVEDDSTEFLLGLTPSTATVSHLHPNQEGIFKLWALFLENVNPMVKIIHYPSLQDTLVQASQDIENIGRGLEALMFAIYLCAVTSIDDAECEKTFREPKRTLLTRYRHGAKKSLARARFLGTADMQVLQAFVLYLLMMREDYDSRTLWTLAGVANRIAQGMGIHRDGTALGLPPFNTELRRRLWWQITILDFRSAELTGSGRFGDFSLSDTIVPTNIDDHEIWPGMTEAPVNAARPTEMITCLIRCEFGAFWKEKLLQKGIKGEIHPKEFVAGEAKSSFQSKFPEWDSSMEERDRNINELEERLNNKFLKYCDLTVPLQLLTNLIGRAAITSMRLMVHHPRRWSNENDIPQTERVFLWNIAVKLIQGDNTAHATRSLKRFMWHINVYFQWQALIYLLGELRKHTKGEEVDAAWKEVDECWENHPEFITDYRKPLHVAVGSLCLKAFEAREKGLKEEYEQKKGQGGFVLPFTTPGYIEMLRQQRATPRRKESKHTPMSGLSTTSSNSASVPAGSNLAAAGPGYNQFQQSGGLPPAEMPMTWTRFDAPASNEFTYDPVMMNYDPNAMVMEIPGNDVQMDWNQWDYLIQEFEMPSAGRTDMGM